MDTVRWGLLSTANINRRLIPAIRSSKRGRLVAIASRDQPRAKAYAAKWRIPHAFGSYQSMLDSGLVDAVYVGLPNHMHAEWSIRAIESGLHVLCEKPFALSHNEIDRMIDASHKHNRVLAEAFMYRHHPQTKIAGDWVHSGKLGEISLIRGAFYFSLRDRANVRMIPEYGGGCLWDVGVYPLSFAQFIYDSAPEVVSGRSAIGDSGVDETFIGQMGYAGGRLAQIASSFQTPYYTSIEILGTKGRLEISHPFTGMEKDGIMIFHPKKGKPKRIRVPKKELYLGQVEDMHAAIIDSAPQYLSLTETRDHVRTTLALYQSANTGGKPINLSQF